MLDEIFSFQTVVHVSYKAMRKREIINFFYNKIYLPINGIGCLHVADNIQYTLGTHNNSFKHETRFTDNATPPIQTILT